MAPAEKPIVGANYVESPAMVTLLMAIVFFGSGFSSITVRPARYGDLTRGPSQ